MSSHDRLMIPLMSSSFLLYFIMASLISIICFILISLNNQQQKHTNKIQIMITLIIASVLFVSLFVLCCFIPLKNNKTLIMAGIVLLLLILAIVNQFIIPKYPLNKVKTAEHFQVKPLPNNLMLNVTGQLYKNSPARTLLKQQRTLFQYLLDKQNQKENVVIHVKNIDNSRFRSIFRQFQSQTQVPAVYVDFNTHNYQYSDLQSALTEGKGSYTKYKNKIVYFIIDNVNNFDQTTALENIFLTYNVSYIIQNFPPNLLEMSTLGKWTHQYAFQGNYISQVLQNHPPRLVQICNKYRTIDYPFYVMSQSQPLSQLCTKLPTNSVTECVRQHMKTVEDKVPFSKVRKCFEGYPNKNVDGVIYQNGMIGLKKDYFYAGKVDKSLFSFDSPQRNQNL